MIRAADDSDFMISVRLPQKKGITVYRTMDFIIKSDIFISGYNTPMSISCPTSSDAKHPSIK